MQLQKIAEKSYNGIIEYDGLPKDWYASEQSMSMCLKVASIKPQWSLNNLQAVYYRDTLEKKIDIAR